MGAYGAWCPGWWVGDAVTRQLIAVDGRVTELKVEGLDIVDGVVQHQVSALPQDQEGALDAEGVERRLLLAHGHAGCPRQDGHDLPAVGVHHIVDEPGRLELAFLIRLRLAGAVQGYGHVLEDVDEPPVGRGSVEVVVQAGTTPARSGA